jgi:hypothetical protein
LKKLAGWLAEEDLGGPRTRGLLTAWGLVRSAAGGADPFPGKEEGGGLAGGGGAGR